MSYEYDSSDDDTDSDIYNPLAFNFNNLSFYIFLNSEQIIDLSVLSFPYLTRAPPIA